MEAQLLGTLTVLVAQAENNCTEADCTLFGVRVASVRYVVMVVTPERKNLFFCLFAASRRAFNGKHSKNYSGRQTAGMNA